MSDAGSPWSVWIAHTRTGRLVAELPTIGTPKWTCAVNAAGSVEVVVALGDPGVPKRDALRAMLAPVRFCLAVAYGQHLVQAGPIWTHRYTDTNATLTIGASGLWGLFERRLVLPPHYSAITDPSADLRIGPASLHSLARALVEAGESRPRADLPVVYPPEIAGTNSRIYRGFDLRPLGDALRSLGSEDGGSEVEFRPRFTEDRERLEWVMRIGAPLLAQSGAPRVYDYGAGLVAVDADTDGSNLASAVFVRGNGMERGLLTGHAVNAELVDAGYPLTEVVIGDHTSVTEQSTLDSYARAYAAMLSRPTELWSAVVRTDPGDGGPTLAGLAPGDFVVFGLDRHPWLPDGHYEQRVLGMESGEDTEHVSLTLQRELAEV
ncbi:hypothetical protein NLX83_21580 [Allokutzneria sp. A3M-2-11 16]|uniref:hypothetical protein n=1 Tax=Allokutzneria sp. A3M-2-11 16 TaxID=2962043 RepID=UPI0020B8E33C|nr:hypothetical protein [Allokutzneria sp. A3M-2-11 16]MCP3801861.1 hypothetical protein [Allokutzneria sp. A3M-2-11 16]